VYIQILNLSNYFMKGMITMKKIISTVLSFIMLAGMLCVFTACSGDDGPIKVGIINQPPEESGYREANVKDFERVFTEENGYEAEFFYSKSHSEQIDAARGFIADGINYLLLSAASPDGWDRVLTEAKDAGVKVFLFDRMLTSSEDLYEAAVVSDMNKQGDIAVNWLREQNLDVYNIVHIQGEMGNDAQRGRTAALDREFSAGNMNRIVQDSAEWSADAAQKIVEEVIASGNSFNVVYAENDDMAKGAVAALQAAGISHGVDKDVIIIGFDCNRWALRELLAGNWNFNVQCSPFQADVIDGLIKKLQAGENLSDKIIISDERGFDARTITQADIDNYGIGD
jgi:simple sugar transport system substrate-binding protein